MPQLIRADGELLVLAMEDVTARRRAEEALLEAGALQSAIFNSANFSSIATDAQGVIQIFNVGAERMLGYTAAEVVDKITPAAISDPLEVIARAGELIATDGAHEFRAPYDNTVLVMPGTTNLKVGMTTVRLGRFEN